MAEDLSRYRNDFPMLQGKQMNGHPLVYLDNAATSFKPQCVIDAVMRYYTEDTTNVERGDYDLSARVSLRYEKVRETVAKFINCDPEEVIYTSGSTAGLNLVANGYAMNHLKEGDVILTTIEEHASDILPWFKVCEKTGAKIRYIELTDEGRITPENVRKAMDHNVKITAFAGVSNVMGYINPVAEISKIVHEYGSLLLIDGAQAVPHFPIDVKAMGIDFLAFSGHKCCGPTGVGALYARKDLLDQMEPTVLGGGSNARFEKDGTLILKEGPEKFEAGTQPIEGVLGMGAALEYLTGVGMENIRDHEKDLRDYLVEKLSKLDNVKIFNPNAETGIVTFNVNGVFPQDAASYLASKGIAVRSGQHCAKILPEFLKTPGTVRASLYFYNTKEDCDALVEAVKTCTVENAVDIFF